MATIVLEDGSGVATANSYQTVQDFKDYFDCIGVEYDATDAEITTSLIAAAKLLEYCYTYYGEISFPDTPQALLWPRTGLCDRRGLVIAANTIPVEIKEAQNELARSNLQARLAFSDNPTNQGAVKRNKLDVLEQEFFSPGSEVDVTVSKTVMDYVRKILQPYIRGGGQFQGANVAVV